MTGRIGAATVRTSSWRAFKAGQALTEFALVLPVILLVLFAIFDLGRAVYAYNTVADAARTAVRLAIVNQDATEIVNAAKWQAKVALASSDLTVTVSAGANVGDPATVMVSYHYTPVTPLIGAIVGNLNLQASSQMPIEYQCSGQLCLRTCTSASTCSGL